MATIENSNSSGYNKTEGMGNDMHLKEDLTTPARRRTRLSNITNLSLSASWASNYRENDLLSTRKSAKAGDSQLRDENAALKKLLLEKDAALEAQAHNLEQMQKQYVFRLRRQSQVNDEIIAYNSRLSKESGTLRDQLKLLHHEYCQMKVCYKLKEGEFQVQQAEWQEQLKTIREMRNKRPSSVDDQYLQTISRRTRSVTHRRHSTAGPLDIERDWSSSTKLDTDRKEEAILKRSNSWKEASVRPASNDSTAKSGHVHEAESVITRASYRQHHVNRRNDSTELEPMMEVCEEESSPRKYTSESSSIKEDSSSKRKSATRQMASESNNSRADDITDRDTDESQKDSVPRIAATGSQSSKTAKAHSIFNLDQRKVVTPAHIPTVTPHFSRRASDTFNSAISRPVRKSVEKVTTYRELPLNTKMRRPV